MESTSPGTFKAERDELRGSFMYRFCCATFSNVIGPSFCHVEKITVTTCTICLGRRFISGFISFSDVSWPSPVRACVHVFPDFDKIFQKGTYRPAEGHGRYARTPYKGFCQGHLYLSGSFVVVVCTFACTVLRGFVGRPHVT